MNAKPLPPPWTPYGFTTAAAVTLAKSGIFWPLLIVATAHTIYCAVYTVNVYRGR